MKVLAATFVVLVSPIALVYADKKPVRTQTIAIHIFTAVPEGGFVDPDMKERENSIKDLEKSLAKKKGIVLAPSPEGADLVVEILGRGREETGDTSIGRDPVWGGVKATKDTAKTLRAMLTAGAYSAELANSTTPQCLFGCWRDVANGLAKKIDKWIDMNYDRLIELKEARKESK